MSGPMIRLTAVSKHYAEGEIRRTVLDGVSCEIGRGQFVAIQGRSGSGKTTLLNLVAGLDLPDSGAVHIDGQAIQDLGERERTLLRRWQIGFVFQFFNLIPTLTVAENLKLGLELSAARRPTPGRDVESLLAAVGLPDRGDSFPDRLSGGEQQRVAIARAIAPGRSLLLADEPTGNLDSRTEQQILDLLRSLPGELGITVVVATHSDNVARGADRILNIEQGRLIEQ